MGERVAGEDAGYRCGVETASGPVDDAPPGPGRAHGRLGDVIAVPGAGEEPVGRERGTLFLVPV